MDTSSIGKWIIFLGIGIIFLGSLIWAGSKIGIPLGKLPGDIRIHREKIALYFPLVTSLLLSLFLTIIINLIIWLSRR